MRYFWVSVVRKSDRQHVGVVATQAPSSVGAIVRASGHLPPQPTDYEYDVTELPSCIGSLPPTHEGRLLADVEARTLQAWLRPRIGYENTAFAERRCDWCSQWYRGPAVYCSLKCALADA